MPKHCGVRIVRPLRPQCGKCTPWCCGQRCPHGQTTRSCNGKRMGQSTSASWRPNSQSTKGHPVYMKCSYCIQYINEIYNEMYMKCIYWFVLENNIIELRKFVNLKHFQRFTQMSASSKHFRKGSMPRSLSWPSPVASKKEDASRWHIVFLALFEGP